MKSIKFYLFFHVLVVLLFFIKFSNNQCISNTTRIFLSDFIYNISGTDSLTIDKLESIFPFNRSQHLKENFTTCTELSDDIQRDDCFSEHCLSIENILKLHSIPTNRPLSTEELYEISPALLYQKTSCQNLKPHEERDVHKAKPPSVQAWGYGFLFVTIINVCSLSGAIVLPCMKKAFYHKVLLFMVALAVGSLAASGLLVLIPEALGLMYTEDHEISDTYIWKASTVFGGIYLFFLIERFLKIILKIKQPNDEENQYPSIKRNTPVNVSNRYKDTKNLPVTTLHTSKSETSFASTRPLEGAASSMASMNSFDNLADKDDEKRIPNGHSKDEDVPEKKQIATVAWMIIFGDGLHNFIDGLTIGAAFTESILAGISICVAVFCEELPHELGDFAILLNSGMTVKRALMYNFLSACMCYLGLIVGTLLGENTTAHDWVFAIAGGMFLYISLVDMLPEMNSAAESEENKKNIGSLQIFIFQNVGLLLGFGVILLMAVYGGEINFEK